MRGSRGQYSRLFLLIRYLLDPCHLQFTVDYALDQSTLVESEIWHRGSRRRYLGGRDGDSILVCVLYT